MKRVRVICLLITIVMTVSMFAACGSSSKVAVSTTAGSVQATSQSADEPLKEVVLKYYFPFNNQPDQDKVWVETNKMVKEKINATVDFQPVDWGSWGQKINIIMASGDDWDLAFTANWTDGGRYWDGVSKGAFLAVDDLLAKYAPTINAYPKKYWDCVRVDGKVYGAINMQIEECQWGLYFLKDIVEKYNLGDIINNAKTMADLEPAFAAVKKGEPDMYVLGRGDDFSYMMALMDGYQNIVSDIHIKLDNPELKAVIYSKEASYMNNLKLRHDWSTKGYFKKDVFTVKDWTPARTAGKVFCYAGSLKPGGDIETEKMFGGHSILVKEMTKPLVDPTGPMNTMTAVNATSKNPERAVMFLEMMNSDKKFFNLFSFGIEGEHYKKLDGEFISVPDDSKYNHQSAWEFGNQFNAYVLEGQPADVWAQTIKLNDEALPNPMTGFNFNPEKVKNELANLDGVSSKYRDTINYGIGDPEALAKENLEKMQSAGIETVLEEVQAQIDEFKSSK